MEVCQAKQPITNVQYVPDPTSSLEARVTTDRSSDFLNYGYEKRQEHQPRYGAALSMYALVDSLDSKNFSTRIENCRMQAVFIRHEDTGEVKVRSHHCGLRWCPMCAGSRQAWIATETERWFIGVHNPRLVTLTLRHTDAPLALQICNLYNYFRKFRRRKFFSDRCTGGVWFFHIKKSLNDHRWHPHLHMLINSDFLEHKRISELWEKITGDSKIVHVKAVHNPTNSVKHAARYSAEPCDLSTLSPVDSLELYYALDGRRIAGTWGDARGISFRPKPPTDAKKWISIGDYNTVRDLKDSDDNANAIWKAYHLGKPVAKGVSMYALELEIYDNFIHAPPKFDPQGRFNFAA